MYKFFTSPLPPSELISKLSEFTDTKKTNPFKPSQYEGEKEIIAQAEGTHFTAEKRPRIGWGLAWFSPGFWFKPVLSGSVTPLKEGSGVIFEGGTPIPIKVLWAVLVVIAATAGGMYLIMGYPAILNFDGPNAGKDVFSILMTMNTALGILILLPLIGWWLTRNELGFVAAAIESKLQLQQVAKSALDG
jgi:hypothetical protein